MKIGRTIAEKDTASKNRVDYYPFGLEMAHSWEQLPNAVANAYRYNAGSEKNNLTGNYETLFRQYDPAIGRMLAVDPVAAKYSSVSPYNYAFNDPVFWNDPTGADPDWNYTGDYIDQYENDIIYRDHGPTYVEGHGGPALSMLNGISAMMNGSGDPITGHIYIGSGNHWSDGMSLYQDRAFMFESNFKEFHPNENYRAFNTITIDWDARWDVASINPGTREIAALSINWSKFVSENRYLDLAGMYDSNLRLDWSIAWANCGDCNDSFWKATFGNFYDEEGLRKARQRIQDILHLRLNIFGIEVGSFGDTNMAPREGIPQGTVDFNDGNWYLVPNPTSNPIIDMAEYFTPITTLPEGIWVPHPEFGDQIDYYHSPYLDTPVYRNRKNPEYYFGKDSAMHYWYKNR